MYTATANPTPEDDAEALEGGAELLELTAEQPTCSHIAAGPQERRCCIEDHEFPSRQPEYAGQRRSKNA